MLVYFTMLAIVVWAIVTNVKYQRAQRKIASLEHRDDVFRDQRTGLAVQRIGLLPRPDGEWIVGLPNESTYQLMLSTSKIGDFSHRVKGESLEIARLRGDGREHLLKVFFRSLDGKEMLAIAIWEPEPSLLARPDPSQVLQFQKPLDETMMALSTLPYLSTYPVLEMNRRRKDGGVSLTMCFWPYGLNPSVPKELAGRGVHVWLRPLAGE